MVETKSELLLKTASLMQKKYIYSLQRVQAIAWPIPWLNLREKKAVDIAHIL